MTFVMFVSVVGFI